ncbi:hypothetical protein VTJ83DRAFT_603 [Remersonia thermophila]|uniref:D-serine dehydratase-like domain-containing protein n=1 Tax=Remersonia thermophila TaxID=72144 RepID=A0ABR4DN70_9PEZI
MATGIPAATALMPSPELKDELRRRFLGLPLDTVPTPSVVLDLAKLERNCERMLEATQRRGLRWRAHIKSHKTAELTRLQVGDTLSTSVLLVVSTLIEADNLLPLLREYQSRGRHVNVLFSFPLFPSAAPRLAAFATALGPGSLSVMIDHPAQIEAVEAIPRLHPGCPVPQVYIKIDTSYGRAGVVPGTPAYTALLQALLQAESRGTCVFHGLYSHAGHSYATRDGPADAVKYLAAEVRGLAAAAREVRSAAAAAGGGRETELVLSVGATPTAMLVQLPAQGEGEDGGVMDEVDRLVEELKREGFVVEVHAGVYPTLDLQQLATHARDPSLMTADDIAISVVAEVASVYPTRGPSSTPEVLINAGTLALGREPVADRGSPSGRDYAGWGMVMPWGPVAAAPAPGPAFPRVHGGWQVGRISQEHGVLVWRGWPGRDGKQDQECRADMPALRYGQRVRVWPNHSCIAGACFDWYLVVDSRRKGREDEVVDVWPRWRGW